MATPGAGKTTFALTAAVQHLATHPARRVVVVAPTRHLTYQWAQAAARLDLHLEPRWSARDGRVPADMHGIVVTYQQAAMQPHALRALAGDAFVILDEVHHAGDDRAWGAGIREAFTRAARRLALSGTPFRSDTAAIPFVAYDDFGQAHPDYEYGYGQALGDGSVVRPVYFPRIDGHMEWVGPDGIEMAAGFDDPLDAARSAQRLRTALSLGGEWLPAVLDQAHAQLDGHPHHPAPRRRPHHRHGPRARPGHRRAHAPAPPRDPDAGAERRRRRVGADRPLRRGVDALDRGGAHGVRGRGHPPPARRGVRHEHRHRALLPSGHRPARSLDTGAAPPEGLPVHPRRPAAAHVRRPHRPATAPQPAPASRRRRRPPR